MRRNSSKRLAVLILAAIAFSVPATAQTAAPSTPVQFVVEQPSGEWLAHVFYGSQVQSPAGDVIGDVNDLMFNKSGQISTVVLGVGGILGMGEKNVAVPYGALQFKSSADGARIIVVALTKAELAAAPAFKATEKTTYDAMKDKAIDLGRRASDKAGELKDQAMKKVDDMKTESAKKP